MKEQLIEMHKKSYLNLEGYKKLVEMLLNPKEDMDELADIVYTQSYIPMKETDINKIKVQSHKVRGK